MENRIKALAEFSGVKEAEITPDEWQENAFTICTNDNRYFVFTDEEANKSAAEMIKETLWAFKPRFILKTCGLDYSVGVCKALEAMQCKSCESCNAFIFALIEGTCGFDYFVESAVLEDGRGHFISGYNGAEEESNGYYIYRID